MLGLVAIRAICGVPRALVLKRSRVVDPSLAGFLTSLMTPSRRVKPRNLENGSALLSRSVDIVGTM